MDPVAVATLLFSAVNTLLTLRKRVPAARDRRA